MFSNSNEKGQVLIWSLVVTLLGLFLSSYLWRSILYSVARANLERSQLIKSSSYYSELGSAASSLAQGEFDEELFTNISLVQTSVSNRLVMEFLPEVSRSEAFLFRYSSGLLQVNWQQLSLELSVQRCPIDSSSGIDLIRSSYSCRSSSAEYLPEGFVAGNLFYEMETLVAPGREKFQLSAIYGKAELGDSLVLLNSPESEVCLISAGYLVIKRVEFRDSDDSQIILFSTDGNLRLEESAHVNTFEISNTAGRGILLTNGNYAPTEEFCRGVFREKISLIARR